MRKKIVAGNWKMNTTLQEGIALAEGLKEALAGKKVNCDVVVCTPFISVASVVKAVEGSVIGVGAEDCSAHEKGAYTGEVAANMIASTGAKYVILGHSERRQYHGENNELLVAKLQQALANGLTPIFCVGEVKEERVNGTYKEVIEGQMEALYTLSAEDFAKCVVAYEPVWAIGTGLTATSEQAEEVHAFIPLPGLGTFVSHKHPEYIANDPETGQQTLYPPRITYRMQVEEEGVGREWLDRQL